MGVGDEVGDGERRVRIHEVQPVVTNAAPFLDRRLGRADVEAAVDLARVGRNHFRRDPLPCQAFGDGDREAGLPGGRGAGDHQQWRSGHDVASVPRSAYGPA
jgi:hypothetical protein